MFWFRRKTFPGSYERLQALKRRYFDSLFARREELEAAVGSAFAWERLDSRRASRIALYNPKPAGPSFDTDSEAREWMVQTMAVWTDVFSPVIAALPTATSLRTATIG
jgi:hypothetical protein